jgi:hypothetical protein
MFSSSFSATAAQSVPAPVALSHTRKIGVSFRGVPAHKLQELARSVEQKYTDFAQHATDFFGADMAGLVCALTKCAYLYELSTLNTRDTSASLEVLTATADVYTALETFLTAFLETRPFLPAGISPDALAAFLRAEGWHSDNVAPAITSEVA